MTDSGITLVQEAIYEKTNEIPVFQEMLTYLDVESKVVTADAMHCQRETSRRIVQKKGDYLFGLKENQPSLLAGVRLFYETGVPSKGFSLDKRRILEYNLTGTLFQTDDRRGHHQQ